MNLIFGILSGIIITYIFEQILQRNKVLRKELWDHHKPIFGYHVHHSTVGILLIIIGLLDLQNIDRCLVLIGLGLGVIIMHSYSAREFTFIEKSNKERKNKDAKEILS